MRRLPGILTLLSVIIGGQAAQSHDDLLFENSVTTILKKKCGDCHGADTTEARLDLSSAAGVVQGGESGKVLEPGTPNESSLFLRVLSGEMPPEGSPRLTKT